MKQSLRTWWQHQSNQDFRTLLRETLRITRLLVKATLHLRRTCSSNRKWVQPALIITTSFLRLGMKLIKVATQKTLTLKSHLDPMIVIGWPQVTILPLRWLEFQDLPDFPGVRVLVSPWKLFTLFAPTITSHHSKVWRPKEWRSKIRILETPWTKQDRSRTATIHSRSSCDL